VTPTVPPTKNFQIISKTYTTNVHKAGYNY